MPDKPATGHTAEPQFLISESGMREAAQEIASVYEQARGFGTMASPYHDTLAAIIARHAAQAPAQTADAELRAKLHSSEKLAEHFSKLAGERWDRVSELELTVACLQGSHGAAKDMLRKLGEAQAIIAKLAQGLRKLQRWHIRADHSAVHDERGAWIAPEDIEALLSLPGVPKEEKNG